MYIYIYAYMNNNNNNKKKIKIKQIYNITLISKKGKNIYIYKKSNKVSR